MCACVCVAVIVPVMWCFAHFENNAKYQVQMLVRAERDTGRLLLVVQLHCPPAPVYEERLPQQPVFGVGATTPLS